MRKILMAAVAAVALSTPALAQDMTAEEHATRANQLTESGVEYLGRALGLYDDCVGDPIDMKTTAEDMIHGMFKPDRAGDYVRLLELVMDKKKAQDNDCADGQARAEEWRELMNKGTKRIDKAIKHAEKMNTLAER